MIQGATTLRLRPYAPDDESAARRAHEQSLEEGAHFLLDWEPTMSWSQFLQGVDEQPLGLNPSEYRVRGTQLAAVVDDVLVGRASVRFELNEFFASRGGHIGYVVLAPYRRRGYATQILRLALGVAHENGVASALLVCDDDNVASANVIERCGGVLESVESSGEGGERWRRYWIETSSPTR